MPIEIIGEHPFTRDEDGNSKYAASSIFLGEDNPVLVTGEGTHTAQCKRYIAHLVGKLGENLSSGDLESKVTQRIDLIIGNNLIFVRPPTNDVVSINPLVSKPNDEDIGQTLLADEVLQEFGIPKQNIKFLGTFYEEVRQAMKKRGELWRINAHPRTTKEINEMIERARHLLSKDGPVCYYNMDTGTRWITYQEFSELENKSWQNIARCLREIRFHSQRENDMRHPEAAFFMAEGFYFDDYADIDFTELDRDTVIKYYIELRENFRKSIPTDFRIDDSENPEWRKEMFSSLIGFHEEEISEEVLLGLCPEFYMHIQWLPGARIEHGEVILDPVFEIEMSDKEKIYDEKVMGIIKNFAMENRLEYINVGRVEGSLSKREKMPGRREVYIVEYKAQNEPEVQVEIIRMQKWDTVEIMKKDPSISLHEAALQSQQYTIYCEDRYNACKELGMALEPRNEGAICETLVDENGKEQEVRLPYFRKKYVEGIATDKIPVSRYENPEFAKYLADLLGPAVASSMIAGKVINLGKVLFDDGDEVVVLDEEGLPVEIVVVDLTGSFNDYATPLIEFASEYAQPVLARLPYLKDPEEFIESYIAAFETKFEEIKQNYISRKTTFELLKLGRIYDPDVRYIWLNTPGSFAYRLDKILERLNESDARELGRGIMKYIKKQLRF